MMKEGAENRDGRGTEVVSYEVTNYQGCSVALEQKQYRCQVMLNRILNCNMEASRNIRYADAIM